jgi:hypothetical protein
MIEIIHNGEKTFEVVTRNETTYIIEATTTSLMNDKHTIGLMHMQL